MMVRLLFGVGSAICVHCDPKDRCWFVEDRTTEPLSELARAVKLRGRWTKSGVREVSRTTPE